MIGRYLVTGALVVQGVVAMAGEPFRVEIVSSPAHVPLGIPADLMVRAENVSGAPVPVAFNRPPLSVQVQSDSGTEIHCPFCTGRWGVVRRLLPANWRYVENVVVPLKEVGRYSLQAVLKHHWNMDKKPAEYPDIWWGRSLSQPVKVEIVEPQGIDREAYEWSGHDPLGDSERYGELLGRFPTSTYAAYVVWQRWGRVTAGGWKSASDRDTFLSWLAGDPDEEYLTWNLPCTHDGRIDSSVTTRLGGRKALECRDQWLELVLASHPDIWFADEVRLRLALDRYRLGDREACAAGLEALAAHGRPYVASKAGELLAAMRAEGMLPGEGG